MSNWLKISSLLLVAGLVFLQGAETPNEDDNPSPQPPPPPPANRPVDATPQPGLASEDFTLLPPAGAAGGHWIRNAPGLSPVTAACEVCPYRIVVDTIGLSNRVEDCFLFGHNPQIYDAGHGNTSSSQDNAPIQAEAPALRPAERPPDVHRTSPNPLLYSPDHSDGSDPEDNSN